MSIPKKNSIIQAYIIDPLGSPKIGQLVDLPEYQAIIKSAVVLRGIKVAELRVLSVDKTNKVLRVCLHASSVLDSRVSTGRAIYITYFSMRNTVAHILRNMFS